MHTWWTGGAVHLMAMHVCLSMFSAANELCQALTFACLAALQLQMAYSQRPCNIIADDGCTSAALIGHKLLSTQMPTCGMQIATVSLHSHIKSACSAFAGYVIGLGTTIAVMVFFNAAQPALLYIVPAVLGAVGIHAVILKEFSEVRKLPPFWNDRWHTHLLCATQWPAALL